MEVEETSNPAVERVLPAPARGDVGDTSRIRLPGDRRVDEQAWGGLAAEERQELISRGRVKSATEPYEGEIRQLIRRFVNDYICEEGDERLVAMRALEGGGPEPQLKAGLYRRSVKLVCMGGHECRAALSNLGGMQKVGRSGFVTLPISLRDVESFSHDLSEWILNYPADLIVYFDDELREILLREILRELNVSDPGFVGMRATFTDHPEMRALRDLDESHLEKLVSIKGTCIRVSPIIPEMQIAVFGCTGRISRNFEHGKCDAEVPDIVSNGCVREPIFCQQCQGRRTFILLHEKCVFTTKQMMKIQESPESIPEGETPQTLFVYLYDENADSARPGDHVRIVGIYRAVPIRRSARTRSIKSIFRTCIDVTHVSRDANRMSFEGEAQSVEGEVSNQENNQVIPRCFHPSFVVRARALAEQPNCHQLLTDSFAPNIWEHSDVKRGLLCQLFGGSTEYTTASGCDSNLRVKRLRARGEIHVLLCGDPSTAKSQFLQHVHRISPRGVYAVGRGTSAAGLTASITRDPETKDFVLESGAVILSDRGVCCIDEFDKMDENTRAILHEVMEQQTVSLAKAGIVCTLNARTAILASANPVKSKYDVRQSVIENINLPPTLLSRFDLIYLILDTQHEALDRKLARHLCNLYAVEEPEKKKAPKNILDLAFLTDYISFARRFCEPKLSNEAKEELISTYISLRGTDTKGSIRATPRQLDSMMRLSTALAKMQLSNTVTPLHVQEAARLTRAATYQALTDPFSGRIDFEQLHTGASETARMRQSLLGDLVLGLLREAQGGMRKEELTQPVDAALANDGKSLLARKELDLALDHFEAIGIVSKIQGTKYVAVNQG